MKDLTTVSPMPKELEEWLVNEWKKCMGINCKKKDFPNPKTWVKGSTYRYRKLKPCAIPFSDSTNHNK